MRGSSKWKQACPYLPLLLNSGVFWYACHVLLNENILHDIACPQNKTGLTCRGHQNTANEILLPACHRERATTLMRLLSRQEKHGYSSVMLSNQVIFKTSLYKNKDCLLFFSLSISLCEPPNANNFL